MRQIFIAPARFVAAAIGMAFVGAGFVATKPEFLAPAGAIIALAALVTLFRPVPIGWLRYRAATSGLLFGALILLASTAAPNDEVASATTTPDVASEQDNAANSPARKGAEPAARPHATPQTANPNPLQDQTKQAVWIEVSKDAVRQRLKDPGSARFRDVIFHAYQGKTPVVCGAVNGKNGFGGYSGDQRFIASGKGLVYMESDLQAGEFATAWNELCRR